MRFVCDKCRAQYQISDDKVGPKGAKIKCKKCDHLILVRPSGKPAPPMLLPVDGPAPKPAAAAPRLVEAPVAPAPAPAPASAAPAVEKTQSVIIDFSQEEASSTPPPSNPPRAQINSSSAAPSVQAETVAPGPELGPTTSVAASSASAPPAPTSRVLGALEDDEIGAAFDHVLGEPPKPPDDGLGALDSDDPLASTRVIDAATMRAAAAQADAAVAGGGSANGTPNGASHEWFIAIDEQQVGPLPLEQVKAKWENGEIGPDSLCWRTGLADWQPLSEVSELASHLAPKPSKPLLQIPSAPSAVMSVSVSEPAMGAGGVGTQVRMDSIPAGPGSMLPTDTGGWRPSAASALASLVKEEMETLSKPQAKPKEPSNGKSSGGLLDIPPPPDITPNGTPALYPPSSSAPPDLLATTSVVPILTQGPTYSPSPYATPAYPQTYGRSRPGNGLSKNQWILIGVGGAVAVLLIFILAILLVRRPAAPLAPVAPIAAAPAPPPLPAAPKVEPPKVPVGSPVGPATPTTSGSSALAKNDLPMPPPPPILPKSSEGSSASERSTESRPSRRHREKHGSSTVSAGSSEGEEIRPAKKERGGSKKKHDEFDDVFAPSGESSEGESSGSQVTERKSTPFIPDAPGGDVPESLGQSDIMQVVLANKPSIVKCVSEQKAKQPDLSGRMVIRWTILTSGKTSNVALRSEEFRSTHMASCISGLIKRWRFPRHKVQGDPIDFPFTF